MGGFIVVPLGVPNSKDYEFVDANLPTRNRVMDAVIESGGIEEWRKGIIKMCRHCLTFDIKKSAFLDGLKKALKFLEGNPSWGRADKGSWHPPNLDSHEVAKSWIKRAVEVVEGWDCENIRVEDDFMICEHEFVAHARL